MIHITEGEGAGLTSAYATELLTAQFDISFIKPGGAIPCTYIATV
jgi:hypothetical protein